MSLKNPQNAFEEKVETETEKGNTALLEEVSVAVVDGTSAVKVEPIVEPLPLEEQEEISAPRIITQRTGFKYKSYCFFKRAFDLVAALLLLIVLSPFILIFLLIKWLEDFKNPVYVSKRIGKNGKEFRFYKIRTMCVGADKQKADLIKDDLNEADGPVFKMKQDPRITKVGRFYRKWSIDELLQLLNIINGSMSVVGPRPPIPGEVSQYTEEQRQRLTVKGGLLCLWQIQKNRHDLKFEDWVNLDLDYIEQQSFWLDIKIICKGFFMVLFDRSGE